MIKCQGNIKLQAQVRMKGPTGKNLEHFFVE